RKGSKPFTDSFARMSDTRVVTLSRQNYSVVSRETKEWVKYWSENMAKT
ncbi:unnamed protein product, partial [marine sediment metagenome]